MEDYITDVITILHISRGYFLSTLILEKQESQGSHHSLDIQNNQFSHNEGEKYCIVKSSHMYNYLEVET